MTDGWDKDRFRRDKEIENGRDDLVRLSQRRLLLIEGAAIAIGFLLGFLVFAK